MNKVDPNQEAKQEVDFYKKRNTMGNDYDNSYSDHDLPIYYDKKPDKKPSRSKKKEKDISYFKKLEKEIEAQSIQKEELSHSDSIIFNSGRRN
jgi:hypothetical protein